MYLTPPSREHETIVSAGLSAPVPSRLAGFVQSSAAYFAFSSGLTPAAGVAAVAVSAGVGAPDPRQELGGIEVLLSDLLDQQRVAHYLLER